MKLHVLISSLVILQTATSLSAQTRTSIANGNWNNPAIWNPVGVPQPTDNAIIINTQVTFNQTIMHGGAQFQVNAGASLISTGQDTISLGSSQALLNGYVQSAVLISSTNDSTVNTGKIVVGEFVHGGTVINQSTGEICAQIGFFSSDVLINNGSINCGSWVNSAQTSGNGQYCIATSFVNSGNITGTADICDASPGSSNDINVGTIASSITNCQAGPCAICTQPNAIAELHATEIRVAVFPNPMNTTAIVRIEGSIDDGTQLELFSMQGQLIRAIAITSNTIVLDRGSLDAGVYLYRVSSNGAYSVVGQLIVQE